MLIVHGFCVAYQTVFTYVRLYLGNRFSQYEAMCTVFATCLQIYLIIYIFQCIFVEFEPHSPTPAYFEFELYLICEVLLFVIAILCHVLFLLLRSITKEKVRFEEGTEMTSESDFLFAHQFITSLFLSFSA